MTERTTPTTIARAFTEAWTRHDLASAANYIAEDVVFDGPLGHTDGKQQYMEGISRLAQIVTGMRIVAAYGDETHALIMYELHTEQYGVLTCAKLFTLRDGKIHLDQLTFDSYPMRQG